MVDFEAMKILQNSLFRLIVTIVCLLAVVSLSRTIYGTWRRRDIVKERATVLAQAEAENKRLKDELAQAESPEFIEKEAREKLGLVREGEQIVIMPKSQSPIPNIQSQTESEKLPNWKRWWRLFF